MDDFAWRKQPWLKTLIVVLTIVATVLLAAHPELRILLPILDGMGLDLLLLLVGGQLLDIALPYARAAWHGLLAPSARASYLGCIFILGTMGPYFDGALRSRGINLW